MTAATVPPPSWIPIGASEIRANTRRFFTRALAISGAGHLAVLAVVLWLRAMAVDTEPRLIVKPVHFAPPLLVDPTLPPVEPRSHDLPTQTSKNGVIDPIEEIKPVVPDPKAGTSAVGPGSKRDEAFTDPPTDVPGAWKDPGEGTFVAFDQPPVPYYRPAPDYPGWARDQGIQGRVVLHVLVGRDGRVTRITVLRDVTGLTQAARDAIAQWRFHPALSGQNAVAVWVEIPIEFKL